MEKKSLLQEIAERIAAQRGIPKKTSESFCRIFFEVIEEGLHSDKFVKVKGFGTFKLIAVSERESVNVNTGERIQISGHTKVAFTPDALIRDMVNKPFAHFQTIILNDEVGAEELEEASAQPSPEGEGASVPPEVAEESSLLVETSTVEVEAESEAEASPQPSPEGEGASVAPEVAEESSLLVEAASIEAEAAPEPDAEAEPEADTEAERKSPPSGGDSEGASSASSGPGDRVRYIVEGYPRRRINWWKTMALGLFLLLLMGLSYFAGYYKVFCPPCNNSPYSKGQAPVVTPKASPQPKTSPQPSPEGEGVRVAPNAAQKSPPSGGDLEGASEGASVGASKEDGKQVSEASPSKEKTYDIKKTYAITGTRAVHTIVVGDNVYNIAAKYYGNKNFAPYIIRHNQLKNPDNIVLGEQLKLPELTPNK